MVPWRFIFSIIMLFLLLFFLGLNINNKAQIRYWFGSDKEVTISEASSGDVATGVYTKKRGEVDIPVIFALFGAFLVGVLVTLPLVFKKKIQYIDMAKELKRSGLTKKKKDNSSSSSSAQE